MGRLLHLIVLLTLAACGVNSAESAEVQRSTTSPLSEGGSAGQRAPDFAATDYQGKTVSLSGLLAKGPAIVLFYRGYW